MINSKAAKAMIKAKASQSKAFANKTNTSYHSKGRKVKHNGRNKKILLDKA